MPGNEPTFSDWLKTEVVPKLDILSEELTGAGYKEQHLDRLVEQIAPLGVKHFHYWAQEHRPTSQQNIPQSLGPAPAPGGSLSNRGGVALESVLDAQGVKWEQGVYRPAGFLGDAVWKNLNEKCREYGFRWNKEAKGWVRQ